VAAEALRVCTSQIG